ncbi:GNAT family N-acetyltransferase [Bacillus alveayuensis]|jgi:[ribosomal protein S5]-alanine N-acetyltransferase|uniref:GNAT family N-acetyltransferase n=1 Tax=Aeribacillus alveayuensis TaxID=279215 RepID=UPI0005CCFF09|nr:GNAT family N-acetyltransferase [Bacillus alveayuensis]
MNKLETKRLFIIPFTLKYAKAALNGNEKLENVSGYRVENEWPSPDYKEILPFIVQQVTEKPELRRWNRLIVHKEEQMIIGEIGCKGEPDGHGIVEIGYGIVPAYQGYGYATEAVQAFVQWLLSLPEITKVTAECLEDNAASIRVLEKAGFKRTSHKQSIIYWEYGST